MNTTVTNDTTAGGRVATAEEYERIIAAMDALARAAAAIEAGPCPDWCTMPNGHVYESNDGLSLDAGVRRDHERSFGGNVYVCAEELRTESGKVTLGEARVGVDGHHLEDLAADSALMLAGQVREAALLAERVNRAQR